MVLVLTNHQYFSIIPLPPSKGTNLPHTKLCLLWNIILNPFIFIVSKKSTFFFLWRCYTVPLLKGVGGWNSWIFQPNAKSWFVSLQTISRLFLLAYYNLYGHDSRQWLRLAISPRPWFLSSRTINNSQSSPYPLQRGTNLPHTKLCLLWNIILNPFLFIVSKKECIIFWDTLYSTPFEGGRGMN